jgi:hypothetical protein
MPSDSIVIGTLDSLTAVGRFNWELAVLPRGPRERGRPASKSELESERPGTRPRSNGTVDNAHGRVGGDGVVGPRRIADVEPDGSVRHSVGRGISVLVRAAKPPWFGRPTVTAVVVAWPPMRSQTRLPERDSLPVAVVPREPNVTRIVPLHNTPIPIKPAHCQSRFSRVDGL